MRRGLSLNDTHVTKLSFQHIERSSTFEEMDLSLTAISDYSLSIFVNKFPNLTILDLEKFGGITDHGARRLAMLKSLKQLSID